MFVPQPNFTQAPNALFDEWLPKLSHVELKVLMVIMRKTFGWHKIRDRISLSQLEKYTGTDRTKIIKAAKNLQKMGLIVKEVSGKNGEQETYYELVVIEDSKNSYQWPNDTPPSGQRPPTKEKPKEKEKEIYKEKSRCAPTAATSKITFDAKKRAFEGITQDDIKAWRDKFPAVNPEKEIALCAEWAMTSPRKDYRKSILTWLRNSQKNHTTPYKPPEKSSIEVSQEEISANKEFGMLCEEKSESKKLQGYRVQAKPDKILFLFPQNGFDEVSYQLPKEEFKNKCISLMKKMKLIT